MSRRARLMRTGVPVLAAVFVVAFALLRGILGVHAAGGTTTVSGASNPAVPLVIDPTSVNGEFSENIVNVYTGQPVFYIQKLPASRTIDQVTIGNLKSTDACMGQNVGLSIQESDSGAYGDWHFLTGGDAYIGVHMDRVTFNVPSATMRAGKAYTFWLASGDMSPCSVLEGTAWPHNSATVDGGPGPCQQYFAQHYYNSPGPPRRYWHVTAHNDVTDTCAQGFPLAPSNFDPSMPTGWLSVVKPSYSGPVVLTDTNCPVDHPEIEGQQTDWADHTTKVCTYPQFGEAAAEGDDGWYYAIANGKWGGVSNGYVAVRDMYFKLDNSSGDGTPTTDANGNPIVDPLDDVRNAPPGVRAGGGNSGAPNLRCLACELADPIDASSGNLMERATDLAVAGPGLPLVFQRSYNSLFNNDSGAAYGRVGAGWSASWSMHLDVPTGQEAGELAIVHNENGSKVPFEPKANGVYKAPPYVTSTLTRTDSGGYRYRLRDGTTYLFSSTGLLTSAADRLGNTTTVSHDEVGRVTRVTNVAGRSLDFGYDADGHLQQVTDPAGRSVTYAYDAGNLTSVTDVGGAVTRYAYDGYHHLTSVTDPLGRTVSTEYDEAGRAIKQTDAAGHVTSFALGDNQTTITDPRGLKTKVEFDSGLMVKKTEALGTDRERSSTYEFDTHGNLVKQTDAKGHTVTSTYDTHGDLLTQTDQVGRTTTYTHRDDGLVSAVTDPSGVTTSYTFDALGELTDVSRPLAGTSDVADTHYIYDPDRHGQVNAKRDPLELGTTFGHDSDGNITSVRDAEGHTTSYTFDSLGRRTSMTTPRGNLDGADPADYTTHYAYNAYGQVTKVTDPLGHETKAGYDAAGNRVSSTDALGHETTFTYDATNRLTSTKRPDGSHVDLAYDADGNLASLTNGLGKVTRYAYDELNRPTSETDPLSRASHNGYDAADRLTSVKDAIGETTSMSYDDAGQLTKLSYSAAGMSDVTYGYDALGRRTSIHDATGDTTLKYDSLGRLTQATTPGPVGATGALFTADDVIDYVYDLDGRLTKITYPSTLPTGQLIATSVSGQRIALGDRPVVKRRYDDAGRVVEIDDFQNRRFLFDYDADGNLRTQTNPNFTSTATTFNRIGLATQSTTTGPNGTLVDLPYDHNQNAQLTSSAATAQLSGTSETYAYDDLNRIAEVALPTSTSATLTREHFAYDAADRITTLGTTAGDVRLQYDNANQLSKAIEPTTGTQLASFSFNANGNRTGVTDTTTGANVTYGYDQANHLVRYRNQVSTTVSGVAGHAFASMAQSSAADNTYRYNGAGLRADLLWDRSGPLPLILEDPAHFYVTGPDGLPLEQVDLTGSALWYHHDQLGSTRALTNQDGHRLNTSDYDAYGRPIKPVDARVNPFGFAGGYTDADSGLIYLRARWYDPDTGQFLTPDTLRLAGGSQNFYSYANNDPANLTDPTGLWCDPDARRGSLGQQLAIQLGIAAALGTANAGWSGSLVGAATALAEFGVAEAAALEDFNAAIQSSVARTAPRTLLEKLALEEAEAGAGRRIMQGKINDPRYPEDVWAKMEHVHVNPDGSKIVIHYWENLITGAREGFKFK